MSGRIEYTVYRTKTGGMAVETSSEIEIIIEKDEDLIHTEVGHTGSLENAIIDEVAQLEDGDYIIIRGRKV